MVIAFKSLKPGDKFMYEGEWYVKLHLRNANATNFRTKQLCEIPDEYLVEIPPFGEFNAH